jgi:hypothetical protein
MLAPVVILMLAACSHGPAGAQRTEQRGVDAFHSIELRGAADAAVQVGPGSAVTLVGADGVLRTTSTHVQNGMLVIENRPRWGWFGNARKVQAHITLPVLNALAMNGTGNVTINGLGGPALALALQGTGNLEAAGQTATLNARINGAGNMDLSRLVAGDASIAVNGAGNLSAHVTGSLQAAMNGVGSITYAGKPRQIDSQVHGVGRIMAAPSAGH